MPELIYTQDDVDKIKQAWESDLFEQKTNDILHFVIKRLDESNGYKNSIGKDVKQSLEEIKEVKSRLKTLEDAREQEKEAAREKKQWFQDRVVRFGIYVTIGWAIINVLQGMGLSPTNVAKIFMGGG